jgi:hypothetical protein
LLGGHGRELDDRPPELAHEAEGDLLALALAQEHPSAFAEREAGHVAKPQGAGRLGRCLAVEQVADELREGAQRAEHPRQGRAPPDLDEVGLHQRRPGRGDVGVDDDGELVGDVVEGQDLVHDRACGDGVHEAMIDAGRARAIRGPHGWGCVVFPIRRPTPLGGGPRGWRG